MKFVLGNKDRLNLLLMFVVILYVSFHLITLGLLFLPEYDKIAEKFFSSKIFNAYECVSYKIKK